MYISVRVVLLLILLNGCDITSHINQSSPSERLRKALAELSAAKTDYERLAPLGRAGMACVDLDQLEQAGTYGNQLLHLSKRLFQDGDPDAIHKGNIILGRIELKHGKLPIAKEYLLSAGKMNGSPVLKSFGPNMTLARELLKKGEHSVVLEYLGLCKVFWENGQDKLQKWNIQIRSGSIPDFGANLYY